MNVEPDPVVDGVLSRARAAASPAAGELAHALTGIRQRIAEAPVNPHELPAPEAPPAAPAARASGKWAAELRRLLGTALALGVGFAIGVQYARPRPSPQPAAPVQSSAPHPISPPLREPAPAQPRAPAGPHTPPGAARVAAEPLGVSRAAGVSARRSKPRQPAARHSDPPLRASRAPETLSFAQVLQSVERAQRAERDLAPELALRLLDELDVRADPATLREERLVTRVLAACDLGDVAAAEQAVQELGDANPASVYGSRIASSCAAPATNPAPSAAGAR